MKTWYSPIGGKVYITQWFGGNRAVYKQFGMEGHNGIDYRVMFSDTPRGRRYFYAVSDGVVEKVKLSNRGYGRELRLRLDTGEELVYGHNHRIDVEVGDRVRGGQVLGLTNNTGFSSGAHLHFGIRPRKVNSGNGYFGWLNPMRHGYFEDGLLDPETGYFLVWDGRTMKVAKKGKKKDTNLTDKAMIKALNKRIKELEKEIKATDKTVKKVIETLKKA